MALTGTCRRLIAALAVTALLPFPVGAQDQVIKPGTGTRLPAPRPTARQLPDGRIEVTWPAVDGAVRYDLWRSVPPAPQSLVSRPNAAETSYIDSDVKAGSTYYYLVAAVNTSGGSGLRGATPPVTATSSPAVSTLAPTGTGTETIGGAGALLSVTATVQRVQPATVAVTFTAVAGATAYRVARLVYRSLANDPNTMDPSTQTSTPLAQVPSPVAVMPVDSLPDATYARWVRYAVTPVLPDGAGTAAVSNLVSVPAATVTRATPTPGTAAVGSATLTVAAASGMKVGATTSLATVGGVGARWMSLNESVATVDAKGAVTGRAGGRTEVVAATAGSDGSLRVVAIPITVTP